MYEKPVEYLRGAADAMTEEAAKQKVRHNDKDAGELLRQSEEFRSAADVLEDLGESEK